MSALETSTSSTVQTALPFAKPRFQENSSASILDGHLENLALESNSMFNGVTNPLDHPW